MLTVEYHHGLINCHQGPTSLFGLQFVVVDTAGASSTALTYEGWLSGGKGRDQPHPCSHINPYGRIFTVQEDIYVDQPLTGIEGNFPWISVGQGWNRINGIPIGWSGTFSGTFLTSRKEKYRAEIVWTGAAGQGGRVTAKCWRIYDSGQEVQVVNLVNASWAGNYVCSIHPRLPDNLGKYKFPDTLAQQVMSMSMIGFSEDPGLLTAECMQSLKALNINTIPALSGIANFGRDVKNLINSAHGKVDLQWLISVYLFNLYGTANTTRDVMDLFKFFQKWSREALSLGRSAYQKTHASFSEVHPVHIFGDKDGKMTHTLTIEAKTMDNGLAQLSRFALDIDVFPELGNVWDLVPYSFVVDWFLPLGEMMDAIDANTYRSTLEIRHVIYSRRLEIPGALPTYFTVPLGPVYYDGDYGMRIYKRDLLREIPRPSLQLHEPQEFNQWLPAGALAAQQMLSR